MDPMGNLITPKIGRSPKENESSEPTIDFQGILLLVSGRAI